MITGSTRATSTLRMARAHAGRIQVAARSLVSDTTSLTPQAPATATTATSHDLPPVHARTHGIHIATLTLRAHHPSPLTQFSSFALHAAHALGIPVSRPAALPVTRALYTVLKSPFVHKKAQENFEKKSHGRVIKVWDAERDVVDKWLRYLKKYSVGGVGIKAVVYDWVPLEGEGTTATTTAAAESVKDKVMHAVEGITRDLKEEVQHAAGKAKEVVEQVAEVVVPSSGKEGKQ